MDILITTQDVDIVEETNVPIKKQSHTVVNNKIVIDNENKELTIISNKINPMVSVCSISDVKNLTTGIMTDQMTKVRFRALVVNGIPFDFSLINTITFYGKLSDSQKDAMEYITELFDMENTNRTDNGKVNLINLQYHGEKDQDADCVQ
jgi:hypothetical protein